MRAPLCAAVLCSLLLGCPPKKEGDVPLTVTNAPRCAAGHEPTHQVLIRLENGSDFVQQALDTKMFAANTWAGRTATVKVALCPKGTACQTPNWIRTTESKVGGGDTGLTVALPKVEVPCDDGTVATN